MKKPTTRERILEHLEKNGRDTIAGITAALDIKYSAVSSGMKRYREAGYVIALINPQTGDPYKPNVWESTGRDRHRQIKTEKSSLRMKPGSIASLIVEQIEKNGPMTTHALAMATGKKEGRVSQEAVRMRKSGIIHAAYKAKTGTRVGHGMAWDLGSEPSKRSRVTAEPDWQGMVNELSACPVNRFNMRPMT